MADTRPIIPETRRERWAMAACYALIFIPLGIAIAAMIGVFG